MAAVAYKAPYEEDEEDEDDDDSSSDDGTTGMATACRIIGAILVAIGLGAILVWFMMLSQGSTSERVVLDFNCTDNTSDLDALKACHLEKSRALLQEIDDMPPDERKAEAKFLEFLLRNHRDYFHGEQIDITVFKERLKAFSETLKRIEERNAAANESNLSNPPVHGITKYADWTPEEFKAILGGQGRSGGRLRRRLGFERDFEKEKRDMEKDMDDGMRDAEHETEREMRFGKKDEESTPTSATCTADWSSRGQVRNQGGCGDCWTFSTAESIRSATIQQTGQDPGVLSTQYIVDCMTITTCKGSVNGCCGGNPDSAMRWLEKQGGIPTQEAYGDIYTSGDQAPTSGSSASSAAGPVSEDGNGITYSGNSPNEKFACKSGIPPAVKLSGTPTIMKTEAEMETYICGTGALSILVDASAWQTYTSGVMDARSCGTKIDHAVLLIGLNQGENAWLVQNSWGVDWGISTSGQAAPTDEYSNCASLAGKNQKGCKDRLQGGGTVGEACQASCGDNSQDGGYIWLQFGANTCDITYEAVQVPDVSHA